MLKNMAKVQAWIWHVHMHSPLHVESVNLSNLAIFDRSLVPLRYMSQDARKLVLQFSTRSNINWPVLSQKMARSLKFWIQVEEELYYLCSEDKGSYCTADLHLYF